jgi:hypothetical protein
LDAATQRTRRPSKKKGEPWLRKIPLDDIKEVIYAVDHSGEDKMLVAALNKPEMSMADNRKYCVDVLEPPFMWAKTFIMN